MVFSLLRKTCNDEDNHTDSGKLFQTDAAVAGKVRSPMVEHTVRELYKTIQFTAKSVVKVYACCGTKHRGYMAETRWDHCYMSTEKKFRFAS